MPGTDSSNTASHNDPDTPRGPIGVGAEAAEGIHDVGMVGGHTRSGLGHRTTGRSVRDGAERSGSEPMRERSWNHESGYGGKGGVPRTSSEQRELAEQGVSVTPEARTRPSEHDSGGVSAMTGYAGRTIDSPPNHPQGTVHRTKADAEAAELAEME